MPELWWLKMQINLTTFIMFIAAVGIAWVFFTLMAKKKSTPASSELLKTMQDMGAIKAMLEAMGSNQKTLSQEVQDVKKVLFTESKVQGQLQNHLEKTLSTVEHIKTDYEASKQFTKINRESLSRIESIIAGTKTKGIAGENIIREALSVFPPEMVTTGFRVKGKEVEFAMVLSDKTVIPIDVKWPSSDILNNLSEDANEQERARAITQTEKEVLRRVAEVSQYIEPGMTAPWAICAVPDSIFSICKDSQITAYKKNVILISYSMTLPYLLTFFSLHMQYSTNIDVENLQRYLIDIRRHLEQMLEILENKIERSVAMLSNASAEYRQIIGSMKGSINTIESTDKKGAESIK